jgi:hypothetical protein
MRQITITAPQGSASEVAKIAFAVGISEISISERRILKARGSETIKDLIELDVGTPVAKAFMDEFTSARGYKPESSRRRHKHCWLMSSVVFQKLA